MRPRLVVLARLAWLALVVSLAAAGTLNMIAPILPDTKLGGVLPPLPRPALTLASIWREELQRDAVAWFERSWGLRGDLVRSDNTLNVALFQETRSGQGVLVGDDGVLFNFEDANYVNAAFTEDESLEHGRLAARVQAKARRHGIALVPVIIPSKTSVWREAFPASRRRDGAFGLSDANIYGAVLRGMREGGAHFVDARELLVREAKTPDDVFAKTSRHWRWGAACRTLKAVIELARAELPELADAAVDCHSHRIDDPAIDGWELDLYWLLNLWPAPPGEVEGEVLDGKPAHIHVPTLFVGNSFFTMPTVISRDFDVLQPSLFYYYNARVANTMTPLVARDVAPHTPEWREETFSKRLIVLGMLEAFLPADGHEFLLQIERELDTMSPSPP